MLINAIITLIIFFIYYENFPRDLIRFSLMKVIFLMSYATSMKESIIEVKIKIEKKGKPDELFGWDTKSGKCILSSDHTGSIIEKHHLSWLEYC